MAWGSWQASDSPPSAQSTWTERESFYLLLRHCLQELSYPRMGWKSCALNEPIFQAALRLGFNYEGTFLQHITVKGQNRDTAWSAMLDHEWPQVREALEQRLGGWVACEPQLSLNR